MNFPRIALAAVAAFVAYFAIGALVFPAPLMKNEFRKYSTIYRSEDSIKSLMPVGMAAMFVAMFGLAVIYAMLYQGGSGFSEGARFGALIGLFCVCSFVIHNYVNLNIGGRLTLQQGIAYFVEWPVVGIVIGLIYRPLAAR